MNRVRHIFQTIAAAVGLIVFGVSLYQLTTGSFWGERKRLPENQAPAVIIDAGHGGSDAGAVANGLMEKDLTLEIAKRVAHALEQKGIPVRMTRDKDVFLELNERANFAKNGQGIVFVSIHINSVRTEFDAQGIETYIAHSRPFAIQAAMRRALALPGEGKTAYIDERDQSLAGLIHAAVVKVTQAKDRGVKDNKNYLVTQMTECPATLVECGFITNEEEALLLNQSGYRARLGDAIAEGIATYVERSKADPLFGIRADDGKQNKDNHDGKSGTHPMISVRK